MCTDVKIRESMMATDPFLRPEECNCLAVRQAARHITQFYDQFLASCGLRTTQFSILGRLRRLGPMTINALAADMVMDRTTLGRNILPLERDGLIAVEKDRHDRRSKVLRLTQVGAARLQAAVKRWAEAQREFERAFGAERTTDMRALLFAAAATDLGSAGPDSEGPVRGDGRSADGRDRV
jgi:DNA-binding MarR family transcriptional regulator